MAQTFISPGPTLTPFTESSIERLTLVPGQRSSDENEKKYETFCREGVAKIGRFAVEYTAEAPEFVTDETPVIIIPGFCGITSAYSPLRHAIAESGKPAVSIKPPRSRSFPYSLMPSLPQPVDKLPGQAAWGIMREIGRQEDITEFDLLVHSMGGLIATRLAARKADYVRSVTFMASAGIDGSHTPRTMLARALDTRSESLSDLARNLQPVGAALANPEALKYVLRNPPRTLRELFAVSGCNIRDDINYLRHLGIPTAAIQFPNDRYFPLSAVLESKSDKLFDVFKIYGDHTAGHNAQQDDPAGVAQAYLDVLDRMMSKAT